MMEQGGELLVETIDKIKIIVRQEFKMMKNLLMLQ